MVRLQRYTGAGRARSANPADATGSIQRRLAVPPESHKTEHRGRSRTIAIGPRGQGSLPPLSATGRGRILLLPAESERRRNQPGVRPGNADDTSQEARKPKQEPAATGKGRGTPRTPTARRCPRRGTRQRRTKGSRHGSAPPLAPEPAAAFAGTEIRQGFGLEAAQVVLGHSKANVTQVYAERDQRLAVEVARQVG